MRFLDEAAAAGPALRMGATARLRFLDGAYSGDNTGVTASVRVLQQGGGEGPLRLLALVSRRIAFVICA